MCLRVGICGSVWKKIGRSRFLEQWGNTFQRLRTTRTTTQALNRMGWRNQCLMCLSLQVCFSSTFLKDWQESGEIGFFGYSILQSVICTHVRSSGFELQRSLHCLDLIKGDRGKAWKSRGFWNSTKKWWWRWWFGKIAMLRWLMGIDLPAIFCNDRLDSVQKSLMVSMPEVRGLSPVRDALWQGEGGRLSSKRHVESLCCMLPSQCRHRTPRATMSSKMGHMKLGISAINLSVLALCRCNLPHGWSPSLDRSYCTQSVAAIGMVWRGELSFVALVRPIEWVYHNPEDMGCCTTGTKWRSQLCGCRCGPATAWVEILVDTDISWCSANQGLSKTILDEGPKL